MHFEENQLSPGSIGISPLPTAHPSRFQPTLVRTSVACYRDFILAMGRSPGFGSNPCYWRPKAACALFGLAFAAAPSLKDLTSQHRLTRRLIMQKARRQTFSGKPEHSPPTVCERHGFRYYFTPLPGCFSPFPHGTGSLSVAKSI
jgi:hypothetical protein